MKNLVTSQMLKLITITLLLTISSTSYADYYLKATDYNTSEFTKSSSGAWYPHNNPDYSDDYITTFSWNDASQYATWQKNISSGEYKIYAFVPDLSSHYVVDTKGNKYKATRNAHYSIYSNGSNISNKTISQSGGGWKYIGKYNLGSNFKIELSDLATSYEKDNKYSIVFSTIKLVPTVVSNGNPPVVERESPTGQNVTLAINESQLFQFEATDVDKDIDYVQILSHRKATDTDTCTWFCGSEGVRERYSWSSAGNYTVTGYVVDDRGNSNSITWNVTVRDNTPQVAKLQPYSITPRNNNIQTNQSIDFNAVIRNRGNVTSGNIQIKWYKDNTLFSTDWIGVNSSFSKISAGDSDNDWSSNTSFSTAGNKSVKFCITQKGVNDQYYDTNEDCKTITVNVISPNTAPTTPQNTAPTTPQTIRKTNSTDNSVSINWGASYDSGGSISGYYIQYTNNDFDSWHSCSSTTNTNQTCSDLDNDEDYKFRVRARDNSGTYSAWRESSYFSTNKETQYAPVLTNTQNLPNCSNSSQKCVAIGQNTILRFNITDQNSNLSRVEINWNGSGSPEDSQNISGGNSNVTSNYIFNSSDIANCPNNATFRIDGTCWKKIITARVKAFDSTDRQSNIFTQEFILYDYNTWKKASDKVAQDKKLKQEQLLSETTQKENYDFQLPQLTNSCQEKRYPLLRVDDTLIKSDPIVKAKNMSVACGLSGEKIYSTKCSDSAGGVTSGCIPGKLDYEIYVHHDVYNESDKSIQGCVNYPASINTFYTENGNRKLYSQGFVNNYNHKDAYLIEATNDLKNKLKSASRGQYQPACYVGDYDYRNWNADKWKLKISNLPEFTSLVQKYQSKFPSASASEIARGVKDGTAEALEYIAREYKDLPSDAIDLAKGVISLIGNFIDDPIATAQSTIDTAGKIKDFVVELTYDSAEIIDKLTDAISHWDDYEKSKYYTKVTVLVGHEVISPTQKLKLIKKISKSGKLVPPSWFIDTYLLVKFKSMGFSISKSNLDNFAKHSDRKNYVYDELKIRKGELAEKDITLAKASSGKEKKSGQWWQNILRGNRFNKEQWNPNIRNELILCNSPNGCNLNPPKYVRLDAYNDTVSPPLIISRKHTQFSKIKTETAKSYIDELARKYKKGMVVPSVESTTKGTAKNTTNIGMAGKKIDGDQILQIPIQDKPISKEIYDYAWSLNIEISQVPTKIKF